MTEGIDHGWCVYILRCADQTLYTGIAKDLSKRLAQHNKGAGAKYTRGRAPVELVFVESVQSHGDALRREYTIKRMSTAAKQNMIGRGPGKSDVIR
ncbi:MAG: GIY-YIG nuclease family protein [Candidatus Thiodiazotropha sp. (ex Dulcina madagascariensis)]|nr:GIY-YIG nuclease family protein [Candidatus Thiodiazotropha sp. (ex Epidulcina cf. delphinae)]MCU7923227.1 GIY-YIG nuclease family protein [Candidatus Thiodiazotropha sp. (ex Dulcina madagascariensis)]MCU7926356.1 GIY-YIG nuclease family protein [Candidatus Thiodiazotropha sp. (ex Dulcina madagascariensis)]MCU7936427.1 GIY-YIG nuclease family protein [Candidatus Thiodiazotropha sp. (ex Dulcina madagascariensis)]